VCPTFTRNCALRVSCCNELTCCLGCHSARLGHKVAKLNITHIICKTCAHENVVEQLTSKECTHCKSDLAIYACLECMVFESTKDIFHCKSCNCCKFGKAEEYFHCKKCGFCISRGGFETEHVCFESNTSCAICLEEFKESKEEIIQFECGHFMHSNCWHNTMRTCPTCRAIIANRTESFTGEFASSSNSNTFKYCMAICGGVVATASLWAVSKTGYLWRS